MPEVLRANCSIKRPMENEVTLKRNATIGRNFMNTMRQGSIKTLKRQAVYPNLIEIVELDQKYVLDLMLLVKKYYKPTTVAINNDKVMQLMLRINKKQSEPALLKDVGIGEFCVAVRQFIMAHPNLKIAENDSNYAAFVGVTRELWQIMPKEEFEQWITAFWNAGLQEIKIIIKKGAGPRFDSRYL